MTIEIIYLHKDLMLKELWINCIQFYPTIEKNDLETLCRRSKTKLKVIKKEKHQIIYQFIKK